MLKIILWGGVADKIIIEKPQRKGFMSKLLLDKYSPYEKTIFIDADCLVGTNIDWWFEEFLNNNSDMSAFGRNIDAELTLKNPNAYYFKYTKCKYLGVEYIPSFNGGVYYFEKSDISHKVFSMAREFADKQFDGGFLFYGDEPYLALAMSINKCRCLPKHQILFYPRARQKIKYIDFRSEKYLYEQGGKEYDYLGVFHFGSNNTKRILYRYWVNDIVHRGNIIWEILYRTGFYKEMVYKIDNFRDKIIHVLVEIKHSTVDKIKKQ